MRRDTTKKILILCLFFLVVRAENSYSSDKESRFVDNGNGTVTDTVKKIMWVKDPNFFGSLCRENEGEPACSMLIYKDIPLMGWEKASWAVKLVYFGGHSDWRLPEKEEAEVLSHIHEKKLENPFGNLMETYWTSSPSNKQNRFWMVSPLNGILVEAKKNVAAFAWPVRDLRK